MKFCIPQISSGLHSQFAAEGNAKRRPHRTNSFAIFGQNCIPVRSIGMNGDLRISTAAKCRIWWQIEFDFGP